MVVTRYRKNFSDPSSEKGSPSWHCQVYKKNGGNLIPPSLEICMFFSVGVETPKDENTAYGMIVPAFSAYDYGCFSAADSQDQIGPMVKEAILLVAEDLLRSGIAANEIKDAGYLVYSANPEYKDFDSWVMVDVDLSSFEGKPQRINISLPDTLIKRIDSAVKGNSVYRDRSHFIAQAARHALNQ